MSDSPFVRCPCEHCQEIIDAARDEVGTTIQCPFCSRSTVIPIRFPRRIDPHQRMN